MITFAILILIVAKALPGLNTRISSIHVIRITSIVFLFAGALNLNSLNLESIGSGIGIYSGFYQVTTISQLIEIFLFLIGGGILIAWPQFKHNFYTNVKHPSYSLAQSSPTFLYKTPEVGTDYSLIVLFSSLGSSLLISSYDLISVYLSIELQSFGLYVLSTLYREKESATAAGLKYFLLGGLSSCIILLGTGIIYSYTGTTNLESLYIINSVIDVNQQYIIQGISLGLSLIFIGFLFKIAAAPLHNWSPDVYDGTPTIVTTWLTIIPKIAILFILLELQVKLGIFGPLGDGLKTIAVNTEQSIDSFIFYIIQYTITNLNIFLVILGLQRRGAYINNSCNLDSAFGGSCGGKESNNVRFTGANKEISFISEFKGLFKSNPLLSISFAVSLFSMAGIPPLI